MNQNLGAVVIQYTYADRKNLLKLCVRVIIICICWPLQPLLFEKNSR